MFPDFGAAFKLGIWSFLCVVAALVTALIATFIGVFTTLAFGVACFLFIQAALMIAATVFVVALK